ncbi:MAG: GDP-L-fucose synthase [Candidatus Neomarinimicrobiota bacterium]
MNTESKIYLAGHQGMVGSAINRELTKQGYRNIITRSRKELDLTRQADVETLFREVRPEIVIIAAAKVGGIFANNTFRAEFIYDNIAIETNIIHAAHNFESEKLLFLGSSCIYPRESKQPMKEEYLLTGELEPTNEPYAVSKIVGIKLCENYYRQYNRNFISVMPTNLYGPNDNFDLKTSHVIPAMIHRIHDAKVRNSPSVTVWGTGKPRREFMYVEDMAEACVFILKSVDASSLYSRDITHLNVGTGNDITIANLAILIKEVVDYKGKIKFDARKPDGIIRKLLDVRRLNELGWAYKTNLRDGCITTYDWFLKNFSK